jgi:hypothetical protein
LLWYGDQGFERSLHIVHVVHVVPGAGIFTAEPQRRNDEEFEELLENGYKWR